MVDIETGERRIVTLRDVATASGVSISTVSRVLDDRTPRSASATAERVRAVADELGYRRNVSASSLRRGVTATIGVLVPRLTDAVMALMFEAIRASRASTRVLRRGRDLRRRRRRGAARDRNAPRRGVDGLVLATPGSTTPCPPRCVIAASRTCSPCEPTASVRHRSETMRPGAISRCAICSTWGIATSASSRVPGSPRAGRDRRAGAERALREAGVELAEERVLAVGYGLDHGIEAAHSLLDTRDRPTAVFAANDNLALGMSSVAQALGMATGRDLSLVGYNDIPLVSRLPVPLTSVHTHFDRIAETALDLLLAPETPARIERTMPTLIPRSSTAAVTR